MCSPAMLAPRLRKKSRPLRPISSMRDRGPDCSAMKRCAALIEIGVESAGQALVAGHQNQQNAVLRPLRQQRVRPRALVRCHRRRHVRQHLAQQRHIRPRGDHAILRAPQLGRRDHLHGLGDLLRVLHRADAPPDVDQARHARLPRACSATKRALNSLMTPSPWRVSASSSAFLVRISSHRPRCALSTKR